MHCNDSPGLLVDGELTYVVLSTRIGNGSGIGGPPKPIFKHDADEIRVIADWVSASRASERDCSSHRDAA